MSDAQGGVQAQLGARVRALRQAKGYTIAQLALLAGLSRSFLSMLETGKTGVSAERLGRLADALGVRASDLLLEADASLIQVVRAGEGPRLGLGGEGVAATLLAKDLHRRLQPVLLTLLPGASHVNETGHAGEELVYVLSGEIVLEVDALSAPLRAGDTAYYPSALRHGYRNAGREPAVFLTIGTPPKPG